MDSPSQIDVSFCMFKEIIGLLFIVTLTLSEFVQLYLLDDTV